MCILLVAFGISQSISFAQTVTPSTTAALNSDPFVTLRELCAEYKENGVQGGRKFLLSKLEAMSQRTNNPILDGRNDDAVIHDLSNFKTGIIDQGITGFNSISDEVLSQAIENINLAVNTPGLMPTTEEREKIGEFARTTSQSYEYDNKTATSLIINEIEKTLGKQRFELLFYNESHGARAKNVQDAIVGGLAVSETFLNEVTVKP